MPASSPGVEAGIEANRLGQLFAQRTTGRPVQRGHDLRHHLTNVGGIGAGQLPDLSDEFGRVISGDCRTVRLVYSRHSDEPMAQSGAKPDNSEAGLP